MLFHTLSGREIRARKNLIVHVSYNDTCLRITKPVKDGTDEEIASIIVSNTDLISILKVVEDKLSRAAI